ETLGNRLLAFKIDSDGTLLHRKVFANFEGMSPLGLCEDSEGAVWVAAARQPLFVRVQQGGRVTHRVHVPGRHAVACQLGGQDGRTLFCITIAANLDDYPNRQQTARVEMTAVDVPGATSSIRFAELARISVAGWFGQSLLPPERRKQEMQISEKTPSPYIAGLLCRCPLCGKGKLFEGFLTLKSKCDVCGLDFSFANAGDGPAIFVIMIAGAIVVGA